MAIILTCQERQSTFTEDGPTEIAQRVSVPCAGVGWSSLYLCSYVCGSILFRILFKAQKEWKQKNPSEMIILSNTHRLPDSGICEPAIASHNPSKLRSWEKM